MLARGSATASIIACGLPPSRKHRYAPGHAVTITVPTSPNFKLRNIDTPMLRTLKWIFIALFVLLVTAAGWFWYTYKSPYGYHPAEPAMVDTRIPRQDVFVYGTLRYSGVRWLVTGRAGDSRPATLAGYRKQDLDVIPDDGGQVAGEIISVTPDELRALDRYERVGVRYQRESVKLEDGSIVWIYRLIDQ